MPKWQRLDVSQIGDVTVVRFRDRRFNDDPRVQEMARELLQLVEQEGHKKLLLNFSSVGTLSSAALGKLIMLDEKAKARGGVLKLSNISPELYEGFTSTKLDRLFDIETDQARALATF